ncbi:Cilia- and flagella-associated protein 44 [Podochytrium sp. JEL0797]|nr:Cilia- and flagella-associated protein 44 [Podochytrium sp. JEL0797]
MGHIKFWQMSATFTGLKLQGYLGKFGASELTDICAFIQLPDGKVLSSTETGNMILWDGGMIKCEIAIKGKKPCHAGKIEVVMMVDTEVYTAGEDGYVRVWDFETIDNADVTSEAAGPGAAPVSSSGPAVARVFEMEFLEEFMIGKDVKIKSMIRSLENPSQFLILDTEGHLYKLDTKQRFIDKALSFHSGGIAGLDMSSTCHAMVTLGADGGIHLYDYTKKVLLANEKFSSGGSAMTALPLCLDSLGCSVAAGFTDGVLRIITYQSPPFDNARPIFSLQYAFKPHKCAISGIAVSPDGTYLATYGSDRTVFFFKIDITPVSEYGVTRPSSGPFDKTTIKITPIGFIEMEEPVTHISFSLDNHAQTIEPSGDVADTQVEGDTDDSEEDEEEDGSVAAINHLGLDGKLALVVCKSGELFRARVPHPSRVDTSLTYQLELQALGIEQWKLDVPAPKIVETKKPKEGEEPDATAPDGNAPPPPPAVETKDEKADKRIGSAIRKARGLAITNTSSISRVFYLSGGYFLVALVNKFGEGEIRSCKVDFPGKSRLILVAKNRFTDLRLNATGKLLLAGTADGMTCLRPIKLEDMLLHKWAHGHETYEHYSKSFDEMASSMKMQLGIPQSSPLPKDKLYDGQYWFGNVHDSDRGSISGVSISFDEAFLCSVGLDGGIFVFRFNPKEINDREVSPPSDFYQARSIPSPTADITDKSIYSIQESKIKSERDREHAEAETKKQATRANITSLRTEYLHITVTMQAAQIPSPAISVDPDLQNDISASTSDRIAIVKKELEWISERESVVPTKLKQKFLDTVQTSSICVKALQGAPSVATFRTYKLPEKPDAGIQSILAVENAAAARAGGNATGAVNGEGKAGANGEEKVIAAAANGVDRRKSTFIRQSTNEPKEVRSKLEMRKALRAERAQLWKQLMDAKPDANYEDRRDVAAIRYAEANMGDYKLKMSEKYIVPESERVDADKKAKQIVILKESIFRIKEEFNEQVFHLRDRKKELIQYIQSQNKQIQQINLQLIRLGASPTTPSPATTPPAQPTLWSPEMDAGCYPEQRFIVTDADIEALKREESKQANQKRGGGGGGDGDFGGFGGGGGGAAPTSSTATGTDPTSSKESRPTAAVPPVRKSTPVDARFTPISYVKSELESGEEISVRKTLECRRESIFKKIDKHVKAFDADVDELMHERVALQADVKLVDMKLLLLYREWVHLKEFEKTDNFLAEKLNSKQAEKTDLAIKIKECQERLNEKKLEISEIIANEKELQDEFGATVGENNKYEEFLSKVFKKKIKRTKKKVKTDGEDEEEEENEEEEDEEDDDEDEDFDEEDEDAEDLDTCPPDLDPTIFERVKELRETKLDLDDALVEIQKAIEGYKKENDSLLKKEKIIDLSLRGTDSEIQDFQTQKQRKLNELDVVVPLRGHQIQYLDEENRLPTDLSQALVFVNGGLGRLKLRIKELQQEKLDIRKSHKELKKMHVSLIKSRKEKTVKLTDLESRAVDVQMLKFGQTIDLEKLERMGINRNADELRDKLTKEDNKRVKELEGCDREIKRYKDTLTDMTRQNTMLLENLVNLTEAHHNLEEALNLSQSTVNAEYSGLQKKDTIERNKLITLVQTQANEIDALKKEIEMLIRKPLRQPAMAPRNASKVPAHMRASGVRVVAPPVVALAPPLEVDESEAGGGRVENLEPFGQNDVAGAGDILEL